MFEINDYVMYSTTGVCQVLNIINEKNIYNMPSEYYVLQPVYSEGTIIKIPVDNKKVCIRPISSKQEVTSLINDIPKTETIWIDNDRQRNAQFKSIIKDGKCNEWIQILKSIYMNREEKKSLGRKISQADEDIVKFVEKLLFEEFSIALEISPEEVNSYILSNMQQ